MMTAEAILQFWFHEIPSSSWWVKDPAFDRLIEQRFQTIHAQAAACELFVWRETPAGRLAEIIVLDQFSRNMYRDTPLAFAQDPLALALAQEAVATGADQALSKQERSFLYMPYMHSESAVIHEQALLLFADLEPGSNLEFERKHKVIIDRFGRYPHRNTILNRESSPEELAFLEQADSSF